MTTQSLLGRTETAPERRSRAGRSFAVVAGQAAAVGGALLTVAVSLVSVAALALLLGWVALHTGLR